MQNIVIEPNKREVRRRIVLCILLGLFGCIGVATFSFVEGYHFRNQLILLFLVIFSLLGGVYGVVVAVILLLKNRPQLILDDGGIHDHTSIKKRFIPWSSVARITISNPELRRQNRSAEVFLRFSLLPRIQQPESTIGPESKATDIVIELIVPMEQYKHEPVTIMPSRPYSKRIITPRQIIITTNALMIGSDEVLVLLRAGLERYRFKSVPVKDVR